MDMNNLPYSSSIEYEDKVRAFSRQKPAYRIAVFEIQPGLVARQVQGVLSTLGHGLARLSGSMKHGHEPSSPVVIRGDSPQT